MKKSGGVFEFSAVSSFTAMLFFLILSKGHLKMPASVLFPVISAGGVLTTALVSVFIYKESLSKYQWAGLTLGIISIITLNI